MSRKDIPRELYDRIKRAFENEPKVCEMRVRQGVLMQQGRFREAMELGETINDLFVRSMNNYIEEARNQVEKVDVADMDMPIEDKERMMQLLLCCFMCADIIESSVLDMNDILHRYDKTMYMEMFNDIRQVMSMSKAKLKYLQENSGYMKDLVWADNCDNMYQMMQSKAGSIMRKRRDDPNYGENMKKFSK